MVWLFAFGEYSFQRPKNMHPFACISKYCGFSSARFFHVINCCRFFFHSIFATSRCSWICLCKSSPVLIYEMRSTITKSACFILFFFSLLVLFAACLICLFYVICLTNREKRLYVFVYLIEMMVFSSHFYDKFKSCWKGNMSNGATTFQKQNHWHHVWRYMTNIAKT